MISEEYGLDAIILAVNIVVSSGVCKFFFNKTNEKFCTKEEAENLIDKRIEINNKIIKEQLKSITSKLDLILNGFHLEKNN